MWMMCELALSTFNVNHDSILVVKVVRRVLHLFVGPTRTHYCDGGAAVFASIHR